MERTTAQLTARVSAASLAERTAWARYDAARQICEQVKRAARVSGAPLPAWITDVLDAARQSEWREWDKTGKIYNGMAAKLSERVRAERAERAARVTP